MDWIGKLLDKVSITAIAWLVLLVASFALFAPTNMLDTLAVGPLVAQNRGLIGGAFLVSAAFVLIRSITHSYNWAVDKRAEARFRSMAREHLHRLTDEERTILRGYLAGGTRTQVLKMESGVVGGLQAMGIIYRASNVGEMGMRFAYNMEPWAWDYLHQHPDLLAPVSPVDQPADELVSQQRPHPWRYS